MRQKTNQELDAWWETDSVTAVPGEAVLVLGAGISMDAPTNLPAAEPLTEALVSHLLDPRAASECLAIFRARAEILGRRVPRLEHLLSVSAKVAPGVLELLRIFDAVEPNRNHQLVAQFLLRNRTWAITTNFDEGIERASGYRIPVHVFDHASDKVQVLYGEQDSNWGLIKVHGSIGTGVQQLGATLDNLMPGLPTPIQELIGRVFSAADSVLVAGYSAGDHFDINAFLRSKLNRPFDARLVWIDHRDAMANFPTHPESIGFRTFRHAFCGVKVKAGPTHQILAGVLGEKPINPSLLSGETWLAKLPKLFDPSVVERHKIAAHLATNVGLATLAQEAIYQLQHGGHYDDETLAIEARAYALEGRREVERYMFSLLRGKERSPDYTHRVTHYRETGKRIRALLMIGLFRLRGMRNDTALCLQTAEIWLDLCRSTQQAKWLRARVVRSLWGWWLERKLRAAKRYVDKSGDLLAADRLQLLRLRHLAYCVSCDSGEFGGTGWWVELMQHGMSFPQLFVNDRYCIPGFYWTAPATYAEMDRLDDLLDIQLACVDMLVFIARREFVDAEPRLLRTLKRQVAGNRRSVRSEYWHRIRTPLQLFTTLIKDCLDKALQIAGMLDNDHARRRVYEISVWADQEIGGFAKWKPQRLFLP